MLKVLASELSLSYVSFSLVLDNPGIIGSFP